MARSLLSFPIYDLLSSSSALKRLIAITAALLVLPCAAWASFHTFAIDQIYSNADGTVQFVVLRETAGFNGAHAWTGHTLTSTHAGLSKPFTFLSDLPSSVTANR